MQRQLLDALQEWQACTNERQATMLWHRDYNLRIQYKNCRDPEKFVPLFRFAIKRKYKDLVIELWQSNLALRELYSREIPTTSLSDLLAPSSTSEPDKLDDLVNDYLRVLGMRLGEIASSIWNGSASLRQLLCNPVPPSAEGWHVIVNHFESALSLGQQETVDAIWQKCATRLRIWYMCQEMNTGTLMHPYKEKARIENTINVFKAAVKNQMTSIVDGLWLSCQPEILAYYEKRVENDEFYREFCFYAEHGSKAIVKKLAQDYPVFWCWFSGQSGIVPVEQTLRHFVMMLELNDADLYMSFWNNNRFLCAAIRGLNSQDPRAIALTQRVLATGHDEFIHRYLAVTQPVLDSELSEEERLEHKRKMADDPNPGARKKARAPSGDESSDSATARVSSDQISPYALPGATLFTPEPADRFDVARSRSLWPGFNL
jgi:hypothetical protein